MLSMTGFGRGSVTRASQQLAVEIRSVNHRSLDIKVRGRDVDAACEIEIIRAVRASLERGAITVSLREDSGDVPALRGERIKLLFGQLQTMRVELGLRQPVDLATVAAFLPDSRGGGAERTGEWPWDVVRPAVQDALLDLRAMRLREGGLLAADMRQRLARMGGLALQIAARARLLPSQAAARFQERLAAVAQQAGIDPGRLAQEVALLAEKLDVSEELVRLHAHLGHLEALVMETGQGANGRKLDFVVQEVGRELNTIASKVQDASIAALVIEGKAELEKIREQAQNIE